MLRDGGVVEVVEGDVGGFKKKREDALDANLRSCQIMVIPHVFCSPRQPYTMTPLFECWSARNGRWPQEPRTDHVHCYPNWGITAVSELFLHPPSSHRRRFLLALAGESTRSITVQALHMVIQKTESDSTLFHRVRATTECLEPCVQHFNCNPSVCVYISLRYRSPHCPLNTPF